MQDMLIRSSEDRLRILQVSTYDVHGGAARVAWNLFRAYRARGYKSYMAVGFKESEAMDVLPIPNNRYSNLWARMWHIPSRMLQPLCGKVRGVRPLQRLMANVGEPNRWLKQWRGTDDFDFPGTWDLLRLMVDPPDIIHCHNLHGGYFDLRALSWLSQQVYVVLTLHDAWLLSGHCAHSFDCERWKTGCGACPDLTIHPSIRRDTTAYNWRRKRNIYANSRLWVATPSRWLMRKVEQSILAPGMLESKVIPNGVNLSVFQPGNRQDARKTLGIEQEAKVLLCTFKGELQNVWQDYDMMQNAIVQAAEGLRGQRLQCIVLGPEKAPRRVGRAELFFYSYRNLPESIALFYQAADVFVHPSKADTFPNAVLEALACGIPVVATAVGGIPEQIKALQIAERSFWDTDFNRFGRDKATGILVPSGDANRMAKAIELLFRDCELCHDMGENAVRDVSERFSLNRQVQTYL